MIEAPALDQMQNAPTAECLTLVLCWTARPDLRAAEAAPSRRERTEAARQAYSAIKQAVMEELERAGSVSVQDLPGTANALATATAEAWLGVAPLLASRVDVKVVPNRTVAFAP
jgi:hypothetical protein